MFFISFVVKPRPDHPKVSEWGGALVNCYMDLPSLDTAQATAEAMIQDSGWEVQKIDEEYEACRADFVGAGLGYFEQAEIDKTVIVFYTWPVSTPDARL